MHATSCDVRDVIRWLTCVCHFHCKSSECGPEFEGASTSVNFMVPREQELMSLHLHVQASGSKLVLLKHRGRMHFSELYSAELENLIDLLCFVS